MIAVLSPACLLKDHVPLEAGKRLEDHKHRIIIGLGGIDRIIKRAKSNASRINVSESIDEMRE